VQNPFEPLVSHLALVVSLVCVVGCVTTGGLEPPGVTLVNLDVVDATLFETTLDVTVRIFNENPESMILDGAVIKLELDGVRVGKGASSERVEVPRLDSVTQRVSVHLNHLAVATRIKGIIESRVVDYGLTGKVYVVQPSGSVRKMTIANQGQLDLRRGGSVVPDKTQATDLEI
jgi:LEA14-like dessication related protein